MKAGGVAEDERGLRARERDRAAVDALGELVVRRIVVAERAPGPELLQLSARRAPRHVFERARLLVDVDEIDERLQEMPIVEVSVPALRGAPLAVATGGRRVPEVDVLELRPHPEIGVCDVEQAGVDAEPKPRVVEPELHAPRVLADDELLPGAPP